MYSRLASKESRDEGRTLDGGRFMEASNMSIQEILEGHPAPLLSVESRMKPEMVMEFAQRLRTTPQTSTDVGFKYVAASIAGQSDIRRQQLSQGHIGDVSRQARLAATCFDVDNLGSVLVCRNSSQVCIGTDPALVDTRGNVFLRGVNVLCSKAQQVLLDSHRAGVTEARGRNLVEDLVQGSDVTLLSVPTCQSELVKDCVHTTWGVNTPAGYVALVALEGLTKSLVMNCLALSSPAALYLYSQARTEQGASPETITQECVSLAERAVHIVCIQAGVSISMEESRALAWMLSYDPGAHKCPVTHKHGGAARNLRPFVTLLNVHFGMFPSLSLDGGFEEYASIKTMSEHLAFGGHFVDA
ncbi:hypothetical protein PtA15_4A97 [Puccinia triticina]|uniref:Uncharacterized protein n=1 Tax=Puccinia triticina TaxID=208348 RepID=A0ABY7CG64_9BASI|nr:uncharacterized protein PtA15_4A97 [Puccinia triticina]WAQ83649.1 hypothetical protein PtA15_4A97 [Puccinia triticina]